MYRIEAHWEVGRRGRPAHAFHLNGKRMGTTVAEVSKDIQGPTRQMIGEACRRAKDEGREIVLKPTLMGWCIY